MTNRQNQTNAIQSYYIKEIENKTTSFTDDPTTTTQPSPPKSYMKEKQSITQHSKLEKWSRTLTTIKYF